MTGYELAKKISGLALEKKGHQVILLNISKLSSFADFFVIVSADSSVQIKAIADHITEELHKQDLKLNHKEGYESLRWILLDYSDVIVHIMNREAREFYGIERLWADAKLEMVTDG